MAGGEQVAHGSVAVDVTKVLNQALNVSDRHGLDQRLLQVVERQKDQVSAKPQVRESATVIRIGRKDEMREREKKKNWYLLIFFSV
jgi:hypothetical protein